MESNQYFSAVLDDLVEDINQVRDHVLNNELYYQDDVLLEKLGDVYEDLYNAQHDLCDPNVTFAMLRPNTDDVVKTGLDKWDDVMSSTLGDEYVDFISEVTVVDVEDA